jgi:hypothetical protein
MGADGVARWGVPREHLVAKVAGCGLLLLIMAFTGDPVLRALAGFSALVLAGYALRDGLRATRLTADAAGMVVLAGVLRQQPVAWSEVERLEVCGRKHLGVATGYLEIDLGEQILLLTRSDLGRPLDQVLPVLLNLAAAGGRPDLATGPEPDWDQRCEDLVTD